jgi:hypothetical protein
MIPAGSSAATVANAVRDQLLHGRHLMVKGDNPGPAPHGAEFFTALQPQTHAPPGSNLVRGIVAL